MSLKFKELNFISSFNKFPDKNFFSNKESIYEERAEEIECDL